MAAPTPVTTVTFDTSDSVPGNLLAKVFGNPMDMYDLAQFTTHLYMAENNDPDSENIYTISRTGVTDTLLDNLNIKTYTNGVAAGEVTFTLTQPGRVGLIDEIMTAQRNLKLPQTPRCVFFLDINFQGYSSDPDDNDAGGQIQHIAGPYRYKLILGKLSATIDEKGSTYDVSTIMHNYSAYRDINTFRMPANCIIFTTTIKAALEDLIRYLTMFYTENLNSYEYQDIFVFDTSDPSVQEYVNEILTTPDKKTGFWGTGDDLPAYREESIELDGTGNLNIKKGATIDAIIRTLFGLSPTFRKHVTKRTNTDDPSSVEVTPKTFLKWYRLHTDVKENQFDKNRKDYSRTYTYKPVVFETARTDIDIPESHMGLAKGKISEIVDKGLVKKAYYYIFTGKNDQIISLDIKFDNGAALLNQPTATSNPSAVFAGQHSDVESPRPRIIPVGARVQAAGGDSWDSPARSPQGGLGLGGSRVPIIAEEPTRDKPARPMFQLSDVPDLQESGAYYGFSNTVFGHLAIQHHLTSVVGSSLVDLSMIVRGDPWYLGKRPNGDILENRESGETAYIYPLSGNFMRDHTFMFLIFQSPRYPDDNSEDEDLGTGYFSTGLNKTFSGLYLIREVSNNFSGGIFTSDIKGHLMIEYNVGKILEDIQQDTPSAAPKTNGDETPPTNPAGTP